ncbi:zinc-binding dehydrogenase [Microterricola viridarii]|uniref:zinc-binding dehydrogenase n=1 Tax=Microterricola viridarii TaxID=412690 RepID=UPI00156055D6|nr:zinc-binding dehydrogenase [Microterricola viridarii]
MQEQHSSPLVARDRPSPIAGPGEVVLRVVAAGLNHLDLWLQQGDTGDALSLPRVPGSDVLGDVTAVGDGVSDALLGERVILYPGRACGSCAFCTEGSLSACRQFEILGYNYDGGYAQEIAVAADAVVPVGADASLAWAAVPVSYITAWNALVRTGGIARGDVVAIWGASGGLGNAALRIASALGARVVAIVGSAEKALWLAATGFDGDVLVRGDDLVKRVRAVTGGRGVDLVLDHVGAATWNDSLRMLSVRGHLAFCGVTTGHSVQTDLRQVFGKQLTIAGSWIGDPADLMAVVELLRAHPDALPVIQNSFTLDNAVAAQEAIADSAGNGKTILRCVEASTVQGEDR